MKRHWPWSTGMSTASNGTAVGPGGRVFPTHRRRKFTSKRVKGRIRQCPILTDMGEDVVSLACHKPGTEHWDRLRAHTGNFPEPLVRYLRSLAAKVAVSWKMCASELLAHRENLPFVFF